MDYCVQQKLPFEVCITSNTFTKKVVKLARFHPIRKFFDKGMLVTVNTDDPVFFMTTLLDEYWICSKSLKFTMDEIKQLIKNSFIASFISDNEKAEYCNQVEAAFAKLQ